ncbi:MAG: pectate lyase, partial [Pseudoxanthomonas sp.]
SYITIADDVTSGVLTTLRKASTDTRRFGFLEAPLRKRIAQAVERGDACLLRLQVRQNGKPTGWAGQYDDLTLQPAQGRKFELPSIAAQESVGVVRYLMSIPHPSPAVAAAVEGAADWFGRVEISGWKLETFDAPLEQYQYHASGKDRRLVRDPAATGLWARFYDLQDNSVVLATRESKRVANYSDIPRERRTGYEWYGRWPQSLLGLEYPKWKQGLSHD